MGNSAVSSTASKDRTAVPLHLDFPEARLNRAKMTDRLPGSKTDFPRKAVVTSPLDLEPVPTLLSTGHLTELRHGGSANGNSICD